MNNPTPTQADLDELRDWVTRLSTDEQYYNRLIDGSLAKVRVDAFMDRLDQYVTAHSQASQKALLERLDTYLDHKAMVTTTQGITPLADGQYVKMPNMRAWIRAERTNLEKGE